jgi:hypothetical protein
MQNNDVDDEVGMDDFVLHLMLLLLVFVLVTVVAAAVAVEVYPRLGLLAVVMVT